MFAPVVKMNTMRVLLSLAGNVIWPLHQLDIKNDFLNSELEEEVYMQLLLGFEENYGREKVCRLGRSLYGLKKSPRAWFDHFSRSTKEARHLQS